MALRFRLSGFVALVALLTAQAACDAGSSTGGSGGLDTPTGTAGSGGLQGGNGGEAGTHVGGSGLTGGGGQGADGGTGGSAPTEWGTLSSPCGGIDGTEIESTSPFYFENSIDFGAQGWDPNLLTPEGLHVFQDNNLGGSSLESEVLSFEVLHRCDLAELVKTEGEISYQNTGGKKTDLLVTIDGHKVGVSVTRAFHYPPAAPYTEAEALSLLTGKLDDVLLSSANVSPADAWDKQILHVIAYDPSYLPVIEQAYNQVPTATKADTVLLVTVTNGNDTYIYQ
jgi:hypothetical protein